MSTAIFPVVHSKSPAWERNSYFFGVSGFVFLEDIENWAKPRGLSVAEVMNANSIKPEQLFIGSCDATRVFHQWCVVLDSGHIIRVSPARYGWRDDEQRRHAAEFIAMAACRGLGGDLMRADGYREAADAIGVHRLPEYAQWPKIRSLIKAALNRNDREALAQASEGSVTRAQVQLEQQSPWNQVVLDDPEGAGDAWLASIGEPPEPTGREALDAAREAELEVLEIESIGCPQYLAEVAEHGVA